MPRRLTVCVRARQEEWPAIKFAPAIHPKHPSGTPQEYHPKGHYLNPQRRQWKKMEFWQP